MSAKYLGVHMPTGKSLADAVREGHKIGCTALQVFTSSPKMWKAASPDEEKIRSFKKAVADTGIDHLISHDTYLVNLCHPDADLAEKSMQTLQGELTTCGLYGIGLVVSHIGSTKGEDVEERMKCAAEKIEAILADTPEEVTLLMENTAGQGSALNTRLEGLERLLDLTGNPERLGVCLDTCHLFAAGYDIRSREGYELVMEAFDCQVGISKLRAVHLNDSKKPLGSRVDRHDNIGKGELGLAPFGFWVNDPRLSDVPMVVETPVENDGHAKDLAALRSLQRSGE